MPRKYYNVTIHFWKCLFYYDQLNNPEFNRKRSKTDWSCKNKNWSRPLTQAWHRVWLATAYFLLCSNYLNSTVLYNHRFVIFRLFLPFSENAMLVIGPEWPGKLATFVLSFRSQIFIMESSVPVPKIRPSGWNWAHVNGCSDWASETLVSTRPVRRSEKAQYWNMKIGKWKKKSHEYCPSKWHMRLLLHWLWKSNKICKYKLGYSHNRLLNWEGNRQWRASWFHWPALHVLW